MLAIISLFNYNISETSDYALKQCLHIFADNLTVTFLLVEGFPSLLFLVMLSAGMLTLIADIKYYKALDGLFVSSVVISLLDARHKCFSILLDSKSPEFLFRLHPQRVPYKP